MYPYSMPEGFDELVQAHVNGKPVEYWVLGQRYNPNENAIEGVISFLLVGPGGEHMKRYYPYQFGGLLASLEQGVTIILNEELPKLLAMREQLESAQYAAAGMEV